MSSKVPLLSTITNYIYRRKGKQVRPLLVFLSAGMNGSIGESTFVAAGMIELLHTATLIHDDVVDEANERRGSFSINALWRSKIAVLVGDFLLSKGLLLAIETNEFELLRNMSNAVKEMSEGELLQIERSRKMNIDEETYFDIIHKKTATLIASCLVNGAVSVGAEQANVERMYEFGVNLGLAFQIKDDIFDYQAKGALGKPTGNDIKENKLTLPLIHALSNADRSTRKAILSKLRKSKRSQKAVEEVIQFANEYGGIDYATQKMNEYKDKAIAALESFPESIYRDALVDMANFVVNRKK
ncbi:polyprenyl synthetase family protein [Perlabentimonas gracilis]|uniref:polyprenyl synthetase family protein n=1 Tax=Perlabentimonas gracilis TaxID=2715279 RepID=UPI00140CA884|nr:polyprenyl synthetase family protein [Perlabentimonas gracilis]NHB67977.1 polyprenyl synthetase family protein [Perlabentimonas gracilis]